MQSLHRVEKSHSPMVCSRQEISRLSVSIAPRSLSPYRHVPPLEMTVAAGSIRSFQKGKWQKRRPIPSSFRPKRSGVEKSHASNDRNAAPHLRHFDRSAAEWRNLTPQMAETPHRPSVISTEAGQPPIGKPLIVQARGQLRLTWKLYAESPQSSKISLSHGMPQAGDLSTQRFNSPRGFYPHTAMSPRSR